LGVGWGRNGGIVPAGGMRDGSMDMEFDKEKIGAAVVELAERVKRAYAENDVELYLSAWDVDGIASMPGSEPVRGHDGLRAAFENRPELPAGATFEVRPLELEPISEDWAYAYGSDVMEFPTGEERVTRTMTFLVLIRKTDAGWKTFREVVSADQIGE